jgi:hypothetical protein
MIDVKALQGQVKLLTADLGTVVAAPGTLLDGLEHEYKQAVSAKRTGATYETWLADVLDQAAVAWVLSCVFVRFCEDNDLVEKVWIGGADPHAPATKGMQARQAHLVNNPLHNDRHWLLEAFGYLAKLPATGRIFGDHNPVWRFDISADAAEALLDFFRHRAGAASLRSPDLDTRFLGDLYQDLSAHARSTYALLQTPVFVEEFILDRAFEPAVAEFGLLKTKVIDPTCGSGHFLLGAFDRLVKAWVNREPATDIRVTVERALGQVTGVDVNPFAVAIARFRLLVAALKACGLSSLERAPQFPVRVGTGDSLLRWGPDSSHQGELPLGDGRPEFAYWTEDGDLLAGYLKPGQYTVVVGNPPYITVKDPNQNKEYRRLYPDVAHRQYALTVPFAARFFELAKRGDHDGDGAGWVGQITANSFMKREFGVKLINDYFANRVELTEVIDTSGAYIPGHGTPTVILVGRRRAVSPRYSGKIRTVLGIRGEPSQPSDPSKGLVWMSIVDQIDYVGSESEWVTVNDTHRDRLANHPWSLSGGGSSAVLNSIESAPRRLSDAVQTPIGGAIRAGADEAFMRPLKSNAPTAANRHALRPLVVGEAVRDWLASPRDRIWYPYGSAFGGSDGGLTRELWQWRVPLAERKTFQGNMADAGLLWWKYMQHTPSAYATPMSIVFAFVATHNHFVLDRGGKVFKQSAPVIKLGAGASEEDHLRLLGVLNSSTACFWLKQVSQNKGNGGIGGGIGDESWEPRYEFTGTKLQEFPLPGVMPIDRARQLDGLAGELSSLTPSGVAAVGTPTREALAEARPRYESTRARMIAVQEELDWEVYSLYGLTTGEPLTTVEPPELALALGARAFEIVLARQVAAGEVETQWFSRHGSTPITEVPARWPADYRALVQRRIALIESDRNIGLLERPEFKRRWSAQPWEEMQAAALRDWLLHRLEAPELWGGNPTPLSVAQLADKVRHDEEFRGVLDLWVGTDHHDLVKTVATLIADEHVPNLPIDRYKPSGLENRARWERAWALQRREDAGEPVQIPVPPKYKGADFKRASFWSNRGKLDVPKERFVSYPKLGPAGEDLYGWAGWDQLDQARALAALYRTRKTQDRWESERLLPILAGLRELEPWLGQWFSEPQRGFPASPAEFFTGLIDTELSQHGLDRSALVAVRGVEELA